MLRIITAFLLSLSTLNLFAEQATHSNSHPQLNYKLVKSLYPENEKPIKYYKFNLPAPAEATSAYFLTKNINDQCSELPVLIKENGTIWHQDEPHELIYECKSGYLEKFQILVVDITKEKPEILASCEIVPFPRIKQNASGNKIELNAVAGNGEHFSITGSGFAPNEKIVFNSRSFHETISSSFQADRQGHFFMMYSPAVKGKKEGSFEIVFKGESCDPITINHFWGKSAFVAPNKFRELKNKF